MCIPDVKSDTQMLNKRAGPFSEFDAYMLRLECEHVVLMVKTASANLTHFATQETIPETLYRLMHLAQCERTLLFLSETGV